MADTMARTLEFTDRPLRDQTGKARRSVVHVKDSDKSGSGLSSTTGSHELLGALCTRVGERVDTLTRHLTEAAINHVAPRQTRTGSAATP